MQTNRSKQQQQKHNLPATHKTNKLKMRFSDRTKQKKMSLHTLIYIRVCMYSYVSKDVHVYVIMFIYYSYLRSTDSFACPLTFSYCSEYHLRAAAC